MSLPSEFTLDLLRKFVSGRTLRRRQLDGLVHSGYITAHPDDTYTITTEGLNALNPS